MKEKKELRDITIKFTIGIVIIAIISQLINIFVLGLDIYMKANEIIMGESNNKSVAVSILIQLVSFIMMYYIMNKIILKDTILKKENTVKLIRNIVIISVIVILVNTVIIVGRVELIAVENFIIYMIAIIVWIPIERKILNNKSEIDEETKKKQNKIIIYGMSVLILIIFIAIGIVCIKNTSEDNEQISMSIFLVQDIDEIQKNNIEQSLKNSKYVENYVYIAGEDAAKQMEEKVGNLSIGDINYLFPAKFEIKVKSKNVNKVHEMYEKMEGIKKITTVQE